ncbi:hypothetical protein ACS0TY_022615 [Phlomoides rotata]
MVINDSIWAFIIVTNEQLIDFATLQVHEEVNLDNSDEDEFDDTLVDYCSSEEDSQKNSVSDDESDDGNSTDDSQTPYY